MGRTECASYCWSGAAPGLALCLRACEVGTGARAGNCSALCPRRAGGHGAGPGRQPATGRLGRDFVWCSNEAKDLHCLLE